MFSRLFIKGSQRTIKATGRAIFILKILTFRANNQLIFRLFIYVGDDFTSVVLG